jgi:hypothetical protein
MTRIPYVRREEPAVRPAGDGLGGGLRRGVAAVRKSSYVNAHPLVLDGGATSFL